MFVKGMEENMKGKGEHFVQTTLNIGSPVASVLSLINLAFLSISAFESFERLKKEYGFRKR